MNNHLVIFGAGFLLGAAVALVTLYLKEFMDEMDDMEG